ncbi:MAG: hypothetical protein HKN68_18085 [Saprospiraceae bacterium]|nr:hypothetical protein [Saprospiraceae bacterium]
MHYLRLFLSSLLLICTIKIAFAAFPIPNSGNTSGMEMVRIKAQTLEDFGSIAGTVTIDGKNAIVTFWDPDSIDILTPPGVGIDRQILITPNAGGTISGGLFSYNPPEILNVSPGLLNAAGGQLVTITGNNFGTSQLGNPILSINGEMVPASNINHDNISFFMPPGTGTGIPIQYSIGGQSSGSYTVDYKPPLLVRLLPDEACTEGGDTIILFGLHFGEGSNAPQVLIGNYSAQNILLSDHMLMVVTPPHEPDFKEVVVTIGGQQSNTISFKETAPKILHLIPSEWNTEGGIPVTINGKNFSPLGANTLRINGDLVTIDTHGASSLTFTAPAGSGSNNTIEVTSGGIKSDPFIFHYPVPDLTSISTSGNSTFGGFDVTLTGLNLGDDIATRVYVNGSEASSVVVSNGTQIQFTAPQGTGTNIPVYIEVGNQRSDSLFYDYELPSLASITGPFTNDENAFIQILTNFISDQNTDMQVFINGKEFFGFNPGPTILLLQDLPSGGGTNNEVYAIVEGIQTNTLNFNYPPPIINSLNPSAITPGDLITINGNSFGTEGAPLNAFLNGTLMEIYSHTPTELKLIVPPGSGTNLPLVIQVGNQPTLPFPVSYKVAGQTEEVQVLGSLKIENLGAVLGNTVLAVGPDGKVSRLRLPMLKVSTIGDTLYLGKDQFVIIPGISEANR